MTDIQIKTHIGFRRELGNCKIYYHGTTHRTKRKYKHKDKTRPGRIVQRLANFKDKRIIPKNVSKLNDTHRENMCFAHISSTMAAWLLLTFFIRSFSYFT